MSWLDRKFMAKHVGKQGDVLVSDVGTTSTIMAYVKSLVQELDQRKTPHCVVVDGGHGSLADIVNITDKGVLTGIVVNIRSITADGTVVHLKITIDGSVVLDDTSFASIKWTEMIHNICIPFNHRFNTSLRVEGSTADQTKTECTFIVTYTVDD